MACGDPAVLAWLDPEGRRPGLAGLATLAAGRDGDRAVRCALSSLPPDPGRIGAALRARRRIGNGLRWVMNVAFGEDRCRVRSGDGAATSALLRRLTPCAAQGRHRDQGRHRRPPQEGRRERGRPPCPPPDLDAIAL